MAQWPSTRANRGLPIISFAWFFPTYYDRKKDKLSVMRLLQWLAPGDDEPFFVRCIPAIICNTIAIVAVYTYICFRTSTSFQSHWREVAFVAMTMFPSSIMGSEMWHRWHRTKEGEKL